MQISMAVTNGANRCHAPMASHVQTARVALNAKMNVKRAFGIVAWSAFESVRKTMMVTHVRIGDQKKPAPTVSFAPVAVAALNAKMNATFWDNRNAIRAMPRSFAYVAS